MVEFRIARLDPSSEQRCHPGLPSIIIKLVSGQADPWEVAQLVDGVYAGCDDPRCARPARVGWFMEFSHGTALIPSCALHLARMA